MDLRNVAKILHMSYLDPDTRGLTYELESGPGIGKSDCVIQTRDALSKALSKQLGLVMLNIAAYDVPDLVGFNIPQKTDKGDLISLLTKPFWWEQIDLYPDGGLLFLDEFGQGSDASKKACAPIILERRVGQRYLPDTWMVVMASNRMSDRSGVLRPLAFIENRRIKLEVTPSVEAWVRWAEGEGIHPFVCSFGSKHSGIVFHAEVPKDPGPFCTPRSLVRTSKAVLAYGRSQGLPEHVFPTDALAMELLAGGIGQGAAAQVMSHAKFSHEVPDPEEILKAPDKAKVPENPAAQHIAAQTCAHIMDGKNCDRVLVYVMRLTGDLQLAAVRSALRRDVKKGGGITQSEGFKKWTSSNKQLLMQAMKMANN